MKLVNFSVTNFRSITKAHKIPLTDATIIIGKNNEGKSNVLRALNIAMNALKEHAGHGQVRSRIRNRNTRVSNEEVYRWERDFPISLQSRKTKQQSIFWLEFLLSEEETAEFRSEIKSSLNGTLPLEISIGPNGPPAIRVAKKGSGQKALSKKSAKIAEFVALRLHFNYIPAIRTDQDALNIVSNMLSFELSGLESDPDYIEALSVIRRLQQPVLSSLADKIKEPLQQFIPSISDVEISVPEMEMRMALRHDFEVIVNDGTPTRIEYKGDGVKSLAALALLKNKTVQADASIIAIEEPESHLHPGAVHQLRNIISELATDNQVLISTHNPLFVNRTNINANIVIDKGKAKPATTVQGIRDILGVQASDNLTHANVVLVVEGETDVISVSAFLKTFSPKLKKAISNNILIVEPLRGASNLSYQLSVFSNALCETYVLLDNDESGRKANEKAMEDGQLKFSNLILTNCQGMSQSEFEDCIDPDIYRKEILEDFGVDLNTESFRKTNSKWSVRMMNCFREQGKPWTKAIEISVKVLVAKRVQEVPAEALVERNRGPIDTLVKALEVAVSKTS